jgi:L-fuculose-phosphate aldolase
MVKTEREHRDDIVEIGRLVFAKGWVASNDGNISIRLDAERILTTPTGVSKGMMHPDDLVVVDMKGSRISGARERTSEIGMHLAVYSLRPEVRAVVHAHPVFSTGFAAAGRSLEQALLPEVVSGLGCIPLAAYGLPGTPELVKPMLPLIPCYDAVLMANHGVACWGEDVWKAYFRMETVEHFARISLVAELLGGPKALPRQEVDRLLDSTDRYGGKAPAAGQPGCPVAAGESGGEEKFLVTRSELLAMVEEALRARGLA